MTRDEILNMQAGKQMRELVATRVMGWVIVWPASFDDRPKEYWQDLHTKEARSVEAWHPDENMVDAWLIVNTIMYDTKNDCNMASYGGHWRCIFSRGNASAETAPLAICRAALLAVMEDDK